MTTTRATELKESERSLAAALTRAFDAPLDAEVCEGPHKALMALDEPTRHALRSEPASAPFVALIGRATQLGDGLHQNAHRTIIGLLVNRPDAVFLPYYLGRMRSPFAPDAYTALFELPAADIAGAFLDWTAAHENDPAVQIDAALVIKCRLAQLAAGATLEIPTSVLETWESRLDVEAFTLALAHGLSPDVEVETGIGLLHRVVGAWIALQDRAAAERSEAIVRRFVAQGADLTRKLGVRLVRGDWGAKKGTTVVGVLEEARKRNGAPPERLQAVATALTAGAR